MVEMERILNRAIMCRLSIKAKREAIRQLKRLRFKHSVVDLDTELLESQIRLLELSLIVK